MSEKFSATFNIYQNVKILESDRNGYPIIDWFPTPIIPSYLLRVQSHQRQTHLNENRSNRSWQTWSWNNVQSSCCYDPSEHLEFEIPIKTGAIHDVNHCFELYILDFSRVEVSRELDEIRACSCCSIWIFFVHCIHHSWVCRPWTTGMDK